MTATRLRPKDAAVKGLAKRGAARTMVSATSPRTKSVDAGPSLTEVGYSPMTGPSYPIGLWIPPQAHVRAP